MYYVILTVVALTAFTLIARDKDEFLSSVKSYFQCEAYGELDQNDTCERSYIQLPHVILSSLSYILLGLFPGVNFIFVISVRGLKRYMRIRKWCASCLFKRPKPKVARVQSSDSQSSSNSTQSSSNRALDNNTGILY